ncbi:hypothetical protein [Campylobacter devanensis]|nr:hypothetical protein [Campylobacter sp. P0135]
MLENGGKYEAICIKPKRLFLTQSFDEICNDLECSIYDNSFIKIFKNRINQYFANQKYDKSDDSFKICLHLRRGDCSTILVNKNKDIITTSWFSRGVHTHSWYNLKDKSGSKHCLIDFNMLDNMINFAKSMHEKYDKKISIIFITDGFDTRMYNIINSNNFKIELKKLGKFVDINVVRNYCNSELDKISNCIFFDKKIVGESKEIFLETIYYILNSNLIISSSRSFIFRVLLGWKDTNLFQIAYLGSIEKTADLHLSKRNVKVYKFKNFNDILESKEIFNMIFDAAQENKNQIDINKFDKISLLNIKSENQKLQKINADLYFALNYGTAKSRIKNQLTYKLGEAMIENSKSLWGYIRMPYILSYIKDMHKKEQIDYQEKIKTNPSLKLPPLESYPDYNEAIKLKNHLSYKLGEALIKANISNLYLI